MKTKMLCGVIALFFISITIQAQSYRRDWRFDDNQRARIHQGWRSGELTAREFRHLNKEQRRLHRAERRMMRDGRLGPVERHKLHRLKEHCSRDIWRKKHNANKKFR
jgi:hypothetical protein